ncbi:AraC family transcriptional regulator [Pedobacter sp. MR22-3]|uniref:AraC family transcriptional regulator n=1 Tax=Pedobacter sp. MR22-3 TaxID=2994552 RepID=UPI0022459645|nr:helix-turn-helix domain-containing protein [Pedobacter sp. MR22-3]MCX2584429.1 helix-turn-helix domain-containing protein [Pedobacter sp. MR22-3]
MAKDKFTPVYKISDFNAVDFLNLPDGALEFETKIDQINYRHDLFTKHYKSDFFVVFLVTKGKVIVEINLKEYCVAENSLAIFTPNDLRRNNFSNDSAQYSAVVFTTNFFAKSGMFGSASDLINYFSTQFSPIWDLKRSEARSILGFIKQLSRRKETLEEHPFGKQLLYSTFHTFLYELAGLSRKYMALINPAISRKENLVRDFTELVQKHFVDDRKVKNYANKLNITPKYLSETVREISGKTAGDIIDLYVIQEAVLLLNNSKLSISEISDRLNFSNQSFFGKFFKRHTGLSPKKQRNAH